LKALVILAIASVAEQAQILAVRSETEGGRRALKVLAAEPLDASVRREGPEVVVLLSGTARSGLAPPPALEPIESIRFDSRDTGLALRVRVPAEVPYEVRRDGTLLTVVFGAPAQEAPPSPPQPPSLEELYKRILPVPVEPVAPAEPIESEAPEGEVREIEGQRTGFRLAFLRLHPGITASYVDADTSLLDRPQPVRARYFQLQPRLQASSDSERLSFDYEPRFRRGSSIEVLKVTSHMANAAVRFPLSESLLLTVSDHYARGALETDEVDPGREYFFGLGRFRRNLAVAGVRFDTGGRLGFDTTGFWDRVRMEEGSGFFDHERLGGSAALRYELGANVRSSLGYHLERVPPPEARPIVESTAHSVRLAAEGEVLPLLMGNVSIGYRVQRAPRAEERGRSYRGLELTADLTKEFSRASTLKVSASRSTRVSAFESNAFYVASSVAAQLRLPLPFSFALAAGAGYHWNDYRTLASELGVPRKDRLSGWSLGLGRPINRWSFVRADYRKDRRTSNLAGFSNEGRAIIVQLGLGLSHASPNP
jgi:hypothetical protein